MFVKLVTPGIFLSKMGILLEVWLAPLAMGLSSTEVLEL